MTDISNLRASLILACGGKSTRMGHNKLLMDICGKPCILRTCEAFCKCPEIKNIIIAAPEPLWDTYRAVLKSLPLPVTFVSGGETRQQSVMNAVLDSREDIIVIHDGARPLITPEVIRRSVAEAAEYGSSVVCVPTKDTIRYSDGHKSYCPERSKLYSVQTPQSFKRTLYLEAASKANGDFTDDAQLLEAAGITPHITIGEYSNIKITTAEDISMAQSLLGATLRIGHGYDVHRLVTGRDLIIGGVKIAYDKGLLGHSDADVLTHAIMDALLGAAALGDIGKLFPDSSDEYKGADSIELLKTVVKHMAERGFGISNVDSTVIAQAPKLAPHIENMRRILADAMGLPVDAVSVKATTEEHLGFTGSGEGIAAHAVAMVLKFN